MSLVQWCTGSGCCAQQQHTANRDDMNGDFAPPQTTDQTGQGNGTSCIVLVPRLASFFPNIMFSVTSDASIYRAAFGIYRCREVTVSHHSFYDWTLYVCTFYTIILKIKHVWCLKKEASSSTTMSSSCESPIYDCTSHGALDRSHSCLVGR